MSRASLISNPIVMEPRAPVTFSPFERQVFGRIVDFASEGIEGNPFHVEVTEDNHLGVLALINKLAHSPEDARDMLEGAKPGSTVVLNDYSIIRLLHRMLNEG